MQSSQGPSMGSPFTRAPLTHHLQNTSMSASAFSAYPYSAYQPHPSHQRQEVKEDTGEGSDAWQAAQNILSAINFGGLTRMPEEDGSLEGGNSAASAATGAWSSPGHLSANARMNVDFPPSTNPSGSNLIAENNNEERAELQAQLALLAAQLADIAEVGKDAFAADLGFFGEDDGDGDDDDESMEVVNVQ
jgi:hypothetical protein